jgi:hypothetical protein
MTQEQFQFVLLSLEFSEEYREMTDEEKWDNTPAMYKDFRKSYFFDPEMDEAECIINYLTKQNNND